VPPFVREFSLEGRQLREIDLPAYVDPDFGTSGVRQNLGLESAAVTPDGQHLVTGFENALVQDGPASTLTTTSASRLLDIALSSGDVAGEYVYRDDAVAEAPDPAGAFTVNGLVELLPFNRRFGLAMERSFSVGAGNTIKIYRYALAGADDVSGVADLDDAAPVREAGKELVLDLDDVDGGLTLDNIEGMTLGPRLPDGSRALLLVSDNNFTGGQVSQFLLFSADGVGPAA
ncbi:MAG TPA: esterase-like activity of phytase family protein, partial [Actinomycetes bacterium]|nr:esterase-like activity of phytase family protein [Actinomycetes bacterium]